MSLKDKLDELKNYNGGKRDTEGLSDSDLNYFLKNDHSLVATINEAHENQLKLRSEFDDVLKKPESDQIKTLLNGYLNFYTPATINPYVPLAAKGPWVVTTCGAVVHDSGGYGMLGQGQSPENVMKAMNQNHVMANIMTASFSQKRLMGKLHLEIGHSRRPDKRTPFDKFVCMNSGSESVTVASRISDLNAKIQTDPQGKYEHHKIYFLGFKGGFHGRTDRPAQVSDSSYPTYMNLASFRDRKNLITIVPNDKEGLINAFNHAKSEKIYFESLFLEPVMGEGNPGVQVTPEFFELARKLTLENDSMLIVDSIQAGIRGQGCLSIVDYPGFQELPPPDMETYSKALNAGQYPLSILALTNRAADLYKTGIYGNTMTSNPRALDVASAVLDTITPDFRKNIVQQGKNFVAKLKGLQKKYPDAITDVQGTGLLFCAHLNPKIFKVVGFGCIEEYLRKKGIGVIHGGENALRFTPHFNITDAEVDLVISKVEEAILNGPRLQ